ncbi:hypothetical protein AA0116_g13441 [Alternaria tenuissima]|nr:hypothetical protein AA0116_g13441 [Alternaria tenuissima]
MRKPDARQLQGREPRAWDESQVPFHLNTDQKDVVVRPLAAYAAANYEAPLAPKQGLEDAPANARGQRQSPIAGTYGLRTPRGKITLVACEGCRRRKSKCDGARPKCNTCQSRKLTCFYDVAGNAKTTIQLRACVRQLAKELDDMKSVVSLLAAAPDRTSAVNWASELEKNGFAHHSAEEVREALSASSRPTPALPYDDSLGILNSSEPFPTQEDDLDSVHYEPTREALFVPSFAYPL